MRKYRSDGLKLQVGISRQGQRQNNQMTLLQTPAMPKMPNLSELASRKSSKQFIIQRDPKTPASTSKAVKMQHYIRNETELKKYEQSQSSLSVGDPQKNARYDSCLRQQKVQIHRQSERASSKLKHDDQAFVQPKKNLTVKLIKKEPNKVINLHDKGINSGEQDIPFSGSKQHRLPNIGRIVNRSPVTSQNSDYRDAQAFQEHNKSKLNKKLMILTDDLEIPSERRAEKTTVSILSPQNIHAIANKILRQQQHLKQLAYNKGPSIMNMNLVHTSDIESIRQWNNLNVQIQSNTAKNSGQSAQKYSKI